MFCSNIFPPAPPVTRKGTRCVSHPPLSMRIFVPPSLTVCEWKTFLAKRMLTKIYGFLFTLSFGFCGSRLFSTSPNPKNFPRLFCWSRKLLLPVPLFPRKIFFFVSHPIPSTYGKYWRIMKFSWKFICLTNNTGAGESTQAELRWHSLGFILVHWK